MPKKKLGIRAKLNRGLKLTKVEEDKYKKTLHKKAWKMMSDKVRERDNFTCFTCGEKGDKYNMHAGHFMHSSSDFDERNIHCQCMKCNHFLSGNLAEYTLKMMRVYGLETVMELRKIKHVPTTYTIKEYNEIYLKLCQTKLSTITSSTSQETDLLENL